MFVLWLLFLVLPASNHSFWPNTSQTVNHFLKFAPCIANPVWQRNLCCLMEIMHAISL